MTAISPLEEFPMIPLEEVAELKGGYAFKSTDYTDKGAFVLRTLNIGANGSIGRENAVFIDENRVPEFERFNLVEWDTVFVMVGATLGKTGLVRSCDLPALLNQNMWVIRAKRSLMNPRFLHYMFASQSKTLLGWASGAARDFVRRDDFRKLMMPSPPLAEQRAIADVLGALDDKIESNQRQQSNLLGICHAAFDVALMNGTDVMKVEDMVRFRNNERKPLSAMERSGMERRYPYYGATGIFDYVDGYLFDDVNILIGEDGSVVNDDGTPVAQMAWGKYWVNNHAHVLSGKAVSTELAYIALARADVRPLITGAVQLKINMGNLKSLEVALPSVEVRGDVNREIQENFALWRAKSDESKMLVGLRDVLLPELLSGRLRVKDAESMMENV